MRLTNFIAGLCGLLLITACDLFKKGSGSTEPEIVYLDTLEIETEPPLPYRPSRTQKVDVIHTKLDVKFDWEKQYLYGKAWVTLKPYFYSTDVITLDAKGFDINEVALMTETEQRQELRFDYNGMQVDVFLPETYTLADTLTLFVEYTSKPNELEIDGSSAIVDAKGLYFINPLNKEPNKPQQIWTQGEPESNSAWFPTIDSPNEKTTQEIYITVEDKYVTLSNGTKVYSIQNEDGTRTDYWKQTQPHAPYLFMMAIGEYAVVSDTVYDSLAVDYYVEHPYEPYARDIFGKTPEMIRFFSEQLNFPYAWDKYSQVVVRDYVSGAMENTSAVIFGEFAQRTKRELLDDSPEDVISHELYHHWFGDVTTCESWANLPLNESFATYGEYLWREYAYGREMADIHLDADLRSYLAEFNNGKAVDMIRYRHDDPGDMFDSHSYAKGGRILHMLRKYVGDEAFFASLNKYLTDNAFKPAEIHHLRLAFEEVTGEDLNWFFNQWFLDNGHPVLEIDYSYSDSLKAQFVTIRQTQDLDEFPVYRLPVAIDLYIDGQRVRHEVTADSLSNTFVFEASSKPQLVNVDAEKMLLCEKEDFKSIQEYAFQYRNAPLYIDRLEAVTTCAKSARKDPEAAAIVIEALEDEFWGIRVAAIKNLKKLKSEDKEGLQATLKKMATSDAKSTVRASALKTFISLSKDNKSNEQVLVNATQDSSYAVVIAALNGLETVNDSMAIVYAEQLKQDPSVGLQLTCARILGSTGDPKYFTFFEELNDKVGGFERLGYLTALNEYVITTEDDQVMQQAIPILTAEAASDRAWFIRYYAYDGLAKIKAYYTSMQEENSGEQGDAERAAFAGDQIQLLDQVLNELLENEENERIKSLVE